MKTFKVTVCAEYTFTLGAEDRDEAEEATRDISLSDLEDWDVEVQVSPLQEVEEPPEMAVDPMNPRRILDAGDVEDPPPPPAWLHPGARVRVAGPHGYGVVPGERIVKDEPVLLRGHVWGVRLEYTPAGEANPVVKVVDVHRLTRIEP